MSQNQTKTITEDDVIEFILQQLYISLDRNELHLERDILSKTSLQLDEKQLEHIRELLMATHLVKSSIGFGKNGFVYLTAQGIQILKTYGNYRNYLKAAQGVDMGSGFLSVEEQNTKARSTTSGVTSSSEQQHYDDMAH